MPKGRDLDTGPIEKEGNLMKNSDFKEEEEENEDNVTSLTFDIWRSSPGKEEQNQISSNPSEVAAPNTEFQPLREEFDFGPPSEPRLIEFFPSSESLREEFDFGPPSEPRVIEFFPSSESLREEFDFGPPSEPRLIEFFPSSESNSRDDNKGDDIPSARDIRDEFERATFLFEERIRPSNIENKTLTVTSGTAKEHFLANSGTENEVNLLLTDSCNTDWHMELLIPQDSSTEWVITGWKDFFSAQNSEDLGFISFYIPSCPDHNKHYLIASRKIGRYESIQMEKQRRLQNQPELRIDAQGGYVNTMLKIDCQTVGVANSMASERESHKGSGTNSGKSPMIRSDNDFIGSIYEGNETAAGHNPGNSSFRKRLTTADVSYSYLYLPVEVSKQHLPTLKPPENEAILNVLDRQNTTWKMKFKRSSQRCLIGGDWGKFVRKHHLKAEDEIIFTKAEHRQPSDVNHYLIRFEKNSNAAASGSEAKEDKVLPFLLPDFSRRN
ncbi:hypothetical protein RHMOL_Rhmol13G0060100 [Rhododendron molle]|uniref:Uncharacterized protein n=1 Tax=Rhododendron molle TaxID=49168 RepID=A0ACC0L3G9_RHOML|nr:hypothetical protein RHMOL_Rhmol13G0060100 [Rhododendron molle]